MLHLHPLVYWLSGPLPLVGFSVIFLPYSRGCVCWCLPVFIHLITHSERFLCFRVSRHTSEANRQEKSVAVLLLEETAAGGDSSAARSKATSPIRHQPPSAPSDRYTHWRWAWLPSGSFISMPVLPNHGLGTGDTESLDEKVILSPFPFLPGQ